MYPASDADKGFEDTIEIDHHDTTTQGENAFLGYDEDFNAEMDLGSMQHCAQVRMSHREYTCTHCCNIRAGHGHSGSHAPGANSACPARDCPNIATDARFGRCVQTSPQQGLT
jgi:hypothetical protein